MQIQPEVPGPTSESVAKAPEQHKKTLTEMGVLRRFFTDGRMDPFDMVNWVRRDAVMRGANGAEVFRQNGVETPEFWSDLATNIATKHYFRGVVDSPKREWSFKQVATRVARVIADAGVGQGLLTPEERGVLYDELCFILIHQLAAFNSPVFYNVGVEDQPQASACFIVSIEDSLVEGPDSIAASILKEARIFKYGSGSGMNMSRLREKNAPLDRGGQASGVISFMKPLDSSAGSIKSGGKTRRAACMRILDGDHPDIRDFIGLKAKEERKMRVLLEAGYSGGLGGEAENTVTGQNANNSVRVSDSFMQLATGPREGAAWTLKTRAAAQGGKDRQDNAVNIFQAINEASWEVADPGLQFHDTINRMNTVPAEGEIRASNPCAEVHFLDDTACNLASINMCRMGARPYQWPDPSRVRHVADIMITSQEILVGMSGYPTERIAERSRALRPLGLGLGNLGALLMANGVPYDSDEGRRVAGALMALICGRAYRDSGMFAQRVGPFSAFSRNQESVVRVLGTHRDSARTLLTAACWPDFPEARNGHPFTCPEFVCPLAEAAVVDWEVAVHCAAKDGIRNAQTTVVAPTGTISLLMDFDTTSGEPAIGLVSWKSMVGGAVEKMVFQPTELALQAVGLSPERAQGMAAEIRSKGHLEDTDLPLAKRRVFACAMPAADGRGQVLSPEAHVLMVAALQPFVSGAISKTCNMSADSTVEDFRRIHVLAWKTGCKAVACYRDGSKAQQPVVTKRRETTVPADGRSWGVRERLPTTGRSTRHKFVIGGTTTGFIHVGECAAGKPREVFLTVSKVGGTVRGMMDTWARAISFSLQLGMPLDELVAGFEWSQFEPAGFTDNPQIPSCTSIADYVVKYLAVTYLGADYSRPKVGSEHALVETPSRAAAHVNFGSCTVCGGNTVKAGSCTVCTVCGTTSGCS